MAKVLTRPTMIRHLIEDAHRDPHITGLVDSGSSSEGRDDHRSDIDVAVFLRHRPPWTVYDAEPVPLRVDFAFHRESAIADILAWPNAPKSVEAMIWYDGTAGQFTSSARQLVGRSLAPAAPAAT